MAPLPAAIRIAQTVGITASAFCSGSILSLSFLAVPAWLIAPSSLLIREWQIMFDRGKLLNPGAAVVSTISYVFLSYRLYGTLNHPKAEIYGLSALFAVGMIPYTTLIMMSTNRKLFKKHEEMKGMMDWGEKATEVESAKGESTKELVDRWGTLNVGRGLFPLVGAVLGLWTTLA